MLSKKFEAVLAQLQQKRPHLIQPDGLVLFYDEHPVRLLPGVAGEHQWVDIHVEFGQTDTSSLSEMHRILQANLEMGRHAVLPMWFGLNELGCLVFVNRIDWRTLSVAQLDQHIETCVQEMNQGLG